MYQTSRQNNAQPETVTLLAFDVCHLLINFMLVCWLLQISDLHASFLVFISLPIIAQKESPRGQESEINDVIATTNSQR